VTETGKFSAVPVRAAAQPRLSGVTFDRRPLRMRALRPAFAPRTSLGGVGGWMMPERPESRPTGLEGPLWLISCPTVSRRDTSSPTLAPKSASAAAFSAFSSMGMDVESSCKDHCCDEQGHGSGFQRLKIGLGAVQPKRPATVGDGPTDIAARVAP
jgi:hypothetical protein